MVSDPELDPPFELIEPIDLSVPLAFTSPQSGRVYPRRFLDSSRLDPAALRRSEDAYVDELLSDVVAAGSPLLAARFPRAYLDVNREPYELDPRMFDTRLPGYVNTRSLRVAGGLGTIARVVGEAQEIYARRLGVDEALARIEALYKPFHGALRHMLARIQGRFGVAVLIDMHSMPSVGAHRDERPRADVILGDRFGTSAAPALVDTIEETFSGLGYLVARNKPYAGGFITEHYGNPAAGLHVVQIELNRALYMDETVIAPLPRFAQVAQDLRQVRDAVAGLPLGAFHPLSAAAE